MKYLRLSAIFAVIMGVYFRFHGIGLWPLTTDEYFLAKSVENLLTYGVPQFPCGGYYVRGIALQYLSAPLMHYIENKELALRLWPVVFNIITIIPLFLLSRKILNKKIAYFVVILFSFSLWEIEVARYARMYAPFQAIFITYIYFLYKLVIEGEMASKKWLYGLSVLGIFFYEGAIFLVMLNYLAMLYKRANFNLKDIIISTLLLIVAVIYLKTDFRHLGVSNYIPQDIIISTQSVTKLPISLPKILLLSIPLKSIWFVIFLIFASLASLNIYKIIKDSSILLSTRLAFCSLIVISLFNQFGLLLYCLALYLVFGWVRLENFTQNIGKYSLVIMASIFSYWFVFTISTDYWHILFNDSVVIGFKKIFVVLFKYPNIFDSIVYEYMLAVPIMLVITLICLGIVYVRHIVVKPLASDGTQLLLTVVIVIVGAVGILRTVYTATLYTYFLYPVLLILIVIGITFVANSLSKKPRMQFISILIILSMLFITSEDYSIKHMFNIDKKEFNYRTVYDWPTKGHFIYREDYRSPAEIINNNVANDDIVISTLLVPDYYLNKLDYQYRNYKNREFMGVIACGGEKEIWTNKHLIYKEEDLLKLITESPSSVWIIMHSDKFKYKSSTETFIAKKYNDKLFYTSEDGMIAVYKLK